jgi:hypothetical protein
MYADNYKRIYGCDLSTDDLVVYFALPLTTKGMDEVCNKIKHGGKPIPLLINFGKKDHFYK